MSYLIDTNVLLRRARPADPLFPVERKAIDRLVRQGETIYITSQNVIEFWNVLTRPVERNGFGMSPTQANNEVQQLESFFQILLDNPEIYQKWRHLVVSCGVAGVRVHDARLVAVMMAHGVTHLLTFNPADFSRFPDITVVHPQAV